MNDTEIPEPGTTESYIEWLSRVQPPYDEPKRRYVAMCQQLPRMQRQVVASFENEPTT